MHYRLKKTILFSDIISALNAAPKGDRPFEPFMKRMKDAINDPEFIALIDQIGSSMGKKGSKRWPDLCGLTEDALVAQNKPMLRIKALDFTDIQIAFTRKYNYARAYTPKEFDRFLNLAAVRAIINLVQRGEVELPSPRSR